MPANQQKPVFAAHAHSKRSALLVGSLPFDSDEDCIKRPLDALGSTLFCLSDGEADEKTPAFPKGNRMVWMVYAIEKLTQGKANRKVSKQPIRRADGMDMMAELANASED
ncbi:hypothetical protein GCM10028818_39030 [Spirosoma horti]